ncbi:MAG: peroxiredoxin [Paracoccaceae bacterium]
MTISVGEKLPGAVLLRMSEKAPEQVELLDRLADRKVVIFGLPGAFTPTCSAVHLPGFISTAKQFFARGVDEIICIAVNDPHVMKQWGLTSGGTAAGISFLADADGKFTAAIGMQFDAPQVGFFGRSRRYSMLVHDGRVAIFNPEIAARVCDLSSGEALLAQM